MASSPITSWQIEVEKMETVTDFIFLGYKITADGDCSHEIKRHLLLGRKGMKPRQHIRKQRHYFVNKFLYSQSYDFFSSSHVGMWDLSYKEVWALKNGSFWIVVLEKILESPLVCKEVKPVNPNENQPWIFVGNLLLKLKIQYFGHLMQRVNSLEMTLMLRMIEGKRRRGPRRMRLLDSIFNSMNMSWR